MAISRPRRALPEGYKYVTPEVKQPGYPAGMADEDSCIDAGDKLKVAGRCRSLICIAFCNN
ncbi:MAG: hypothetical protein MZV63_08625 [Marinilabiliales bacterium]|nr:hypothetical protein [Marinilabiliales bacterium]